MATRRIADLLSVVVAVLAMAGCHVLVSEANGKFPCAGPENCPSDRICVAGLCEIPSDFGEGQCDTVDDCVPGFECVANACVDPAVCGDDGCGTDPDEGVVFRGDFDVEDADDWARLQDVDAIEGELSIGTTSWNGDCDPEDVVDLEMTEMVLANLRSVTGVIRVCRQPSLRAVSFPALERGPYQGPVFIGNAELRTINLEKLEYFDGGARSAKLEIKGSPRLERLDAPLVPALDWLSIDLETPGGFASPALDIDLRSLAAARFIDIDNAPGLESLNLDSLVELTDLEGDLDIANLGIENSGRATFSFPQLVLVTGEIEISESAATSVEFPALESARRLLITENPNLTSLEVGASTEVALEVNISECPALDACIAADVASHAAAEASVNLSDLAGDPNACN